MNHTNILEQLGLNRTQHKKLTGHFNVGLLIRPPFKMFADPSRRDRTRFGGRFTSPPPPSALEPSQLRAKGG